MKVKERKNRRRVNVLLVRCVTKTFKRTHKMKISIFSSSINFNFSFLLDVFRCLSQSLFVVVAVDCIISFSSLAFRPRNYRVTRSFTSATCVNSGDKISQIDEIEKNVFSSVVLMFHSRICNNNERIDGSQSKKIIHFALRKVFNLDIRARSVSVVHKSARTRIGTLIVCLSLVSIQ